MPKTIFGQKSPYSHNKALKLNTFVPKPTNVIISYTSASGLSKTLRMDGVVVECFEFTPTSTPPVEPPVEEENSPPSVSLTLPVDEDSTTQTRISFVFVPSDLDGIVTDCNLNLSGIVDANSIVLPDADENNTLEYTLSVGSYDWNVSCVDDDGNVTVSETRTITITSVGPAFAFSEYFDFSENTIHGSRLLGSILNMNFNSAPEDGGSVAGVSGCTGEYEWCTPENYSGWCEPDCQMYCEWDSCVWGSGSSTDVNYILDNTVYNNYGTCDVTSGYCPDWNSIGGHDGNGVYEFDGVDDYIDTGLSLPSFPMTISFWGKVTNSYGQVIGNWNYNGHSSNSTGIGFDFNSSQAKVVTNNPIGGPGIYWIWNYPSDLDWIHAVFVVHDVNNYSFYKNGVLLVPVATNGTYVSSTDLIRIGSAVNTSYIAGSIDDVQIFNRALTEDEIATLYSDGEDYISKYVGDGNYTSFVDYNSTSSYWNVTPTIAVSEGSPTTYDLCLADVNCVSYWDFDSGNSDSNIYHDEKGSMHGTPTGTNTATGLSSGALRFDGVDDYINTAVSIDGQTSITLSYWVYLNELGPDGIMIGSRGAVVNGAYHNNPSGRLWFFLSPMGYLRTDAGLLSAGNWYHIVMTWATGTNPKIYVDGNKIIDAAFSSTNAGTISQDGEWLIGHDPYSEDLYWDSILDEVLIYNDALSESEVEELYKAGLSQHASTSINLYTRTANDYNVSDANLVAFWPLNGDANDLSGNDNHGTVSGATPTNDGLVGGAYSFAGDDYITFGSDDSLDMMTHEFTISTWFKTTSTAQYNGILNKWNAGGGSDQYRMVIYDGVGGYGPGLLSFNVYDEADIYPTDSLSQVNDGEWHHAVGIRNSTHLLLYLDGVYQDSVEMDSSENVDSTANFEIGAGYNTVGGVRGWYFTGSIDEVRIYNRALSAGEIQNLYELGSYHITGWSDWSSATLAEDGAPIASETQGKFLQVGSMFSSNSNNVSPYFISYLAGVSE